VQSRIGFDPEDICLVRLREIVKQTQPLEEARSRTGTREEAMSPLASYLTVKSAYMPAA
jgi:hypothetical protein